MMKLVIATRNPNKLEEIRAIFQINSLEIIDLRSYPELAPTEEDGATFEENAIKKAREAALATGEWVLADDSGLAVEALHGEPGVFSARYAGEPSDYRANNAKLLDALAGQTNRAAVFHCVIALSSPDGTARTVQGICRGTITNTPSGTRGFGYDPLFVPEGNTRTFAQLDAEHKNAISHRAVALRLAISEWATLLDNTGSL